MVNGKSRDGEEKKREDGKIKQNILWKLKSFTGSIAKKQDKMIFY